MRRIGYILSFVFLLVLAVAASLNLTGVAGSNEDDKGVLATLISKALSSPGMTVSVGAVDGALTSDATIRDIVISDANGPWFKLDRARLVWTRSALLLRRLSVERLEIGKLEILRKPAPSTGAAAPDDGPLLPDLPVKVEIATFSLEDLALGSEFVGVPAHLGADGKARLGNPSEGLDLTLQLNRKDAVGSIGVRVSFVPETGALTLNVVAHEAAGGLIARAASLPDLPPVDFDLNGDGTLDSFNAKLLFKAGPDIGANGGLNLVRQGRERILSLDAMANIEGLLPEVAGPVFAEATRLSGKAHLGDDNSYSMEGLSISAKAGRIDIDGRIGSDKSLDGRISLRSTDQPGGARSKAAQIGSVNFQATAKGFLHAPEIAASFLLDNARLPQGEFKSIKGDLALNPTGPVLDPATRLNLSINANGDGLSFADKALAAALGDRFNLVVRGVANAQGDMDISVARATLPSLEATYSGKAGPNMVAGRLLIDAPDLSRFARLAGLDLKGAFKATADLAGDPTKGQIGAAMALAGQRIETGIEALDPLLDGKFDLDGEIDLQSGGGFRFTEFTIDGRHVAMRIDGAATKTAADLTAKLTIPDASKAFEDIVGRADAVVHLTGSLARPDLSASLSINDAKAMGRAIPRLTLKADARDILGELNARAELDGLIGRSKAQGVVTISKNLRKQWSIATQDLAIGDARIVANLNMSDAKLIAGLVNLKISDLDELSPLVMQRMAGRLDADVKFDSNGGRQNIVVKAAASGLRAPSVIIGRLDADARVNDLHGAAAMEGLVSIDKAIVAGETLSRLRLNAKNSTSVAGGSEIALAAEARGIALDARGTLVTGGNPRLSLAAFNARKGAQKITLAREAKFELVDKGVRISSLVLNAGSGRLSVEGAAGERLDLTVSAKSFPLGFASLADSSLQLEGLLDADARISGNADAPAGNWQLRIAKLGAPQIRSAGLPPLQVAGSGQMSGGRTSLQASIDLGKGGRINLNGSAPVDGSGRLDIKAVGSIDAALANTSLAASGRSLAGKLTIDAKAEGAIEKPNLSGIVSLTGGTFSDPIAGVKLEKISATARARGDEIVIERATASTRNGGAITLSGNVRVAPEAGFPANIRIAANNAELVSSPIVTAVADVALDLTGPLARRPRIVGKITLDRMDVSIPERLPLNNSTLSNLQHVDPPKAVVQRMALQKAARQKAAQSSAFNADLDITLSAPTRIFVRGRGIDAELGGDLRLNGTLAQPVAQGGFEMRRGSIDVASQRLDFSKGQVNFTGELTPNLDFIAKTSAGDVTAQVEVSGPASNPKFAFSSTPVQPQDEVISRLLFARASGSLTAVQALQLAQTVAELSGEGGPGVFSKLRKSLGVDSLDVRMGADGQPTVGASRYISRTVSVGVRTGAKPEDSAVSVGVDVTRRLKASGDMGADGKASVGVGFEWEY